MSKQSMCAVRVFLLCIVTLLSTVPMPASASTESSQNKPRKIRVAFPMQDGLTQKDKQGQYNGYTYDYLLEIAQYTGWEYEFVEVPGTLNEALIKTQEMLETGQIDIAGGILKNEVTEQTLSFPEYSYGYSYTALFLPDENTSINEANFQETSLLRIASFKNAVKTKEKLDAFCKINNITYEFVDCEDEDELLSSVRDGRADVYVGSSLTLTDGMKMIAQFDGVQFYFATTKGHMDIVQELNRSILAIKQAKPYFETNLYDRYFSSQPSKLYFSQEEQQYITSARPLRVVLPENAPIQSKRPDGTPWGISVDILNHIQKTTGLNFTYQVISDYESALTMVDDDEADIVCGIPYNYQLAQEHNVLMSNPIISTQGTMITRNSLPGESSGKRIAIIDRQANVSYPEGITTVAYNTAGQCMDAVLNESVDGAYLSLYSAEYLGYYTKYRNLRLFPQTDKTFEFCLGTKKEANNILISILNKAINNMTAADRETIVYQNMNTHNEKITLGMFIAENPFVSLGISCAFFLILLIVVGRIFQLRIRAGKLYEVENQRYHRLYELANEYIYEYDCKKDSLTLSKSFAGLFGLPEQLSSFRLHPEVTDPEGKTPNPSVLEMLRGLGELIQEDDAAQYTLPDGEKRWYRNTFTRIDDSHGQALYFIGKLTDIQEEVEELAHLEQKTQIDGLTGIYNAASVKHIIGEHLRHQDGLSALLIVDIDYFKNVNDRLGHYTGDITLRDFAGLLSELTNKSDIIGRLGGDEFVVYLDNVENREQVQDFCSTLCRRARRTYTNDNGNSCSITISIGALLIPHQCTFMDAYPAADKLLYSSKEAGRDRYTVDVFSP